MLPSLPHLDLFVPTLGEAAAISGQGSRRPLRLGSVSGESAPWRSSSARTAASSPARSSRGIYLLRPCRQSTEPGPATRLPGMLYGRLAGWPVDRSAALANAAGALAVTAVGAVEGVRGLAETLALAGLVGGVNARLNRLFAADGKCFDVAVDHGFFGEGSFLTGSRTWRRRCQRSLTQRRTRFSSLRARLRFSRICPVQGNPLSSSAPTWRTSTAALLHSSSAGWSTPPSNALHLDAACVVVNLLLLPDEPELHEQCVWNVSALGAACDRWECR